MKTSSISLIITIALVVLLQMSAQAEPMGTEFTYQGRLIDTNKVANGLYDFQFKLFDANSAGSQLGTNVNKQDIDVIDGYFTVELDFGGVFDGSNRWLDIGIRPGIENDPSVYTVLSPRQKITPTPYAIYAASAPGSGGVSVPFRLSGSLTSPAAIISATNSDNGNGVYGQSAIGAGVYGQNSDSGNVGHLGGLNSGAYGYGISSIGVNGQSVSNYGVYGQNLTSYNEGYLGGLNYGAHGLSATSIGVLGQSVSNSGVYGQNLSSGNVGYLGGSNTGAYGYSANATGVYGYSGSGYGGYFQSNSGYSGYFMGKVYVSGNVGVGTENPGMKLEVASGDILVKGIENFTAPGNQAILYMGDTNHSIRSEYAYGLIFGTWATPYAMVVDEWTGNVGIGTTVPAGKLDVNGSIYQRGGVLHADYVFQPGYKLESIDKHSEFMWQEKHLPAIPKIQKDENGQEIIEIGSHSRGVVEELEKAHIYIEQLNKENKELRSRLTTLDARLDTMESLVTKLSPKQEGGIK